MKIGIDIRCLMGDHYSGVAWYAFNLLDNIFKLDQRNEYFLFYNSSKLINLPNWDYSNVKFVGYHYPNKLFNLSLNFFSRPLLDEAVGGVDVFFSPNLHFSPVSDKCRSLVAVHDLSFLIYPKFFTLKHRLWHQLILRKQYLKRADIILADSQSTKKDLIDLLKISDSKIKVVYLGVTDNYFTDLSAPELVRIEEKYNLPEKFFLFLSTIEPRKNLEAIIKAINLLDQDVALVVAGNWGWKCNQLKTMAVGHKRLKFIDYVDEKDKQGLYQLATGLAYPSYYEGFGLPILESLAAGCPVIAGNNSSQGEVLGDCGLLVDPYNVTDIKQAMERLLNDTDLRNELNLRGRLRAKEFSWNKTAQAVLNIFEQK